MAAIRRGFRDAGTYLRRELGREGRAYEFFQFYVLRQRRDNECGICFDEFFNHEFHHFRQCEHGACLVCLRDYISSELDNAEIEFRCPFDPEHLMLDDRDLAHILRNAPAALKEKLSRRQLRHALNNLVDLMECPSPQCSNAVYSDYLLVEANFKRRYRERAFRHPLRRYKVKGGVDLRKFTCGDCNEDYCVLCKRKWTRGQYKHDQMSCEKYVGKFNNWTKEQLALQRKTEEHFARFSRGNQKKYITCSRCNSTIERNGGCSHMTCSNCRFEFCWKCGKQFPDECNTGCPW